MNEKKIIKEAFEGFSKDDKFGSYTVKVLMKKAIQKTQEQMINKISRMEIKQKNLNKEEFFVYSQGFNDVLKEFKQKLKESK